ncbi:hypothetical protein TVAG_295640 [Trichomonas vaginalis G3]|uniref:Uncharacterized protein n=1 Tax=Trichomonas vaginalis (strain ATCC PRA-98 / G3) TaxID=412133 RepID=A2F231_TRIV3|nr:prolactin regulatory element binding protein family [Trichomonas vaginalis G3]EAY01030.1 hypothetical protein TVAG_295640 [Trichomonas vaginalis G3]KAI5488625.1 prolactin regulatory element binding protein family [Trichomonas vaginalis G3]|eukprot:XP_001313916.1 hypothetical protein [Trichomonas vaginalis G3]
MFEIGYPAYSVSPGCLPKTVYIAGGGGKSKVGIDNSLKVAQLEKKGLQLVHKYDFDDVVSMVTYDTNGQKFIAAAIGPCIKLFDKKFHELSSFDTETTELLFRNIEFSPDSKKLIAIDGSNVIYLLSVPGLRLLGKSETSLSDTGKVLVQRGLFYKHKPDSYCILVANAKGIKMLEPNEHLDVIASTDDDFGCEPRNVSVYNDLITVCGNNVAERKCLIVQAQYKDDKLQIIKRKEHIKILITAAHSNEKEIALGTCNGDVHVLERNTLKQIYYRKEVHKSPITSITQIEDAVITSSIDRRSAVVRRPKGSLLPFGIFLMLLMLLISFYVYLVVYEGRKPENDLQLAKEFLENYYNKTSTAIMTKFGEIKEKIEVLKKK